MDILAVLYTDVRFVGGVCGWLCSSRPFMISSELCVWYEGQYCMM